MYTVRLRHWQAAACVATTLLSALPPGVVQAQQTKSQQQLEQEFNQLAQPKPAAKPTPAAQAPAATPAAQTTAPTTTTFPAPAAAPPAAIYVPPLPTPAPQQTQVSPTVPVRAGGIQNDTTGTKGLPQAPAPKLTEPLYMRTSLKDYSKGQPGYKDPLLWYKSTKYPESRLSNSPQLDDLLRDGKIYLSLSDAVTLAIENNYDIAIARINLDIADTDIERAKSGQSLRGVSTGIVANTLGGSTTTISGGGGPGGTSSGTGGGGAGASGLVLSTNGGGLVTRSLPARSSMRTRRHRSPTCCSAVDFRRSTRIPQRTTLSTSRDLPRALCLRPRSTTRV
jgi:hypothetical protein